MDYQRLRNLTTGRLHTTMSEVHEDLEWIVGSSLFTHMLPNVSRAVEPWLREQVLDARFWDGEYDTSHVGDFALCPMTEEEASEALERYTELREVNNPLKDKQVIFVETSYEPIN